MTDDITQIAHNLHIRLMKLESTYLQTFIGPGYEAAYGGDGGIQNGTMRKAMNLIQKVISFFDWDAPNRSDRFSKHDIIFTRLLSGNSDLSFFNNHAILIEMIPSVFKSHEFGFGRGTKAAAAVIVLQIMLRTKLLTDAEIATCIVETVEQQYSNGSRECEEVIEHFILMIKNSLSDEICSRCITPWPPRLRPDPLACLKHVFEENGFNTTVSYSNHVNSGSAETASNHDSEYDFSGWMDD